MFVFCLLQFLNHCFERLWVVHREVSEHLSVELDVTFTEFPHEFAVRHAVFTNTCVDTLNPKATEVSFLVLTTDISVLHSFLYSILRYGPNILTATKVSFGLLHYFLAPCSRRYTVY